MKTITVNINKVSTIKTPDNREVLDITIDQCQILLDSDGPNLAYISTSSANSEIARLTEDVRRLTLKYGAIREMMRNYIKYNMPASPEILKDRLSRQFNVNFD